LGYIDGGGPQAIALFTANPFARLLPPLADGASLKRASDPQGDVFPLFFAALRALYPFAFSMAALIEGRFTRELAQFVAPWALLLGLLPLAIVVWSYYDAAGRDAGVFWNPVEHAAFGPWLIGMALLHALAAADERGALTWWTVLLAILVFALPLLAAFGSSGAVLQYPPWSPIRRQYVCTDVCITACDASFAQLAWRGSDRGGGRNRPIHHHQRILSHPLSMALAARIFMIGAAWVPEQQWGDACAEIAQCRKGRSPRHHQPICGISVRSSRLPVAAVVLIGGVCSTKLGRPDAIHSAAIARMSVPKAGASAVGTPDVPGANHAGDMETMIKRLSEKLARDPANGEGWFLLARSHLEMGRHLEAADAFSKAIAQLPPDLGLFADFADARVMADGKQWTKAARDALQRAIELDPKHVKSLALLGSEAFERRAYAEAMSFWQRVTEVASPGSIEALEARANLDEAKVLAAGGIIARASAASPVSVGGACRSMP
jgi:tetratricopeptide (TPR) repeat protein